MDLNKITARVRPRNPYEAADLGVLMARQWFRPLMLLWVIPSFPLMLVLFFVFREQPLWALLILWWLKPLLETLQLQFVAEALFNPQACWQDYLKQTATLLRYQLFGKLLIQRWSLSRSFNMPVGELERLTGKQRERRLTTLHRNAGSTSLWLTLLGNGIESLLVTAIFVLAWMFIPMEMSVDFELSDFFDSPLLFPTLAWGGYLAMWIVSPFYVCCGFMLYINRRTWLEAWDIELTFRQLAAQQQGGKKASAGMSATAMLLMYLLLPLGALTPADSLYAQDASSLTPEQGRDQIMQILENDDFNEFKTKTGLRWIDTDKTTDPDPSETENWWESLDGILDYLKGLAWLNHLLDWLGALPQFLEILLWGLVAALLVFLVYQFRNFRMPLTPLERRARAPTPSHLFGLELNQHSLPADVLGEARRLWQAQQTREAVSLLYRSALSFLVHERHLQLDDSNTEYECVTLCGQRENKDRAEIFSQLTRHWIRLAYGHVTLNETEFETLCQQWPQFINTGASA